jgi:hypothetical protein
MKPVARPEPDVVTSCRPGPIAVIVVGVYPAANLESTADGEVDLRLTVATKIRRRSEC